MLGAPITVTPPSAELIQIENAKSYLRIDDDALELEVGMLAAAAVQDLEEMTGQRLLNQTVELRADAFADLAHLRVAPVRSVTSIAYRDSAGADQLVPVAGVELVGAPLEQAIRPLSHWPAALTGSILVRLEVGYGPTPEDVPAKLRFAAYALLRGKFEEQPVDVEPLITNHRVWL